jgi:predicted heme/steroid binding protein/uncharacterized membrane protein
MGREIGKGELAKFNGTEERPVWVAVDGKVYDVSRSKLWATGIHMKRHASGRDLSAELSAAPHGKEVLSREVVREVGILVREEGGPTPDLLERLFLRYPILRRHPHPMMVHFPMAYSIGAAIFMFLDLVFPKVGPFEQMSFAMVVMAAFFTPLAIGTGLLTWGVNYAGRRIHQVTRKLQLAVLMALAEIVCLALRIGGPVHGGILGWLYFGLVLFLALDALMLGYYGGQLTFPYERDRQGT